MGTTVFILSDHRALTVVKPSFIATELLTRGIFPKNAKKSKEILKLYGLDDYFNSIIFCEDNTSKANIANAMGVNVMIDDKKEVLDCFDKSIKTILFNESHIHQLFGLIIPHDG